MPESLIQKNVSLAPLTSWLVGGSAEYFAMPTTRDEVLTAVMWAFQNHQPLSILGGGTNVLVSDDGVKGLVLCLRRFSQATQESRAGRLYIEATTGTSKSELLKIFLKHQLAPALFLAGLPGDVGGGVVMNAGVGEAMTPREFVELVDWVDVLPLNEAVKTFAMQKTLSEASLLSAQIRRFTKSELQWSYRHCSGWQPGLILRVGLSWPLATEPDLVGRVKEANKVRLSKQPLHLPSCGSVFMNPPGQKAGALIDQCGLRGFQIGGAQVSEKHANFIVNAERATAQDLHQVIEHVKSTVLQKMGIALRTEVVYLGEWPSA